MAMFNPFIRPTSMTRTFASTLVYAALAASLMACSTPAQHTHSTAPTAVENRAEPTVSRAQIAQGIYELVYSDKLDLLFVASAGSFSDSTVPYQILIVNPADLKVVGTIPLTRKAFSLALDDQANRLYVGNTGQGAITIVDTQSRQVLQTVQLAPMLKGKDGKERPEYHFRQLMLDPANHRLYMPAFDNTQSKLFVIDTQANKVEKIIPGFGFTATGIALDAKHQRLYVSNMQGEAVVVDTQSNEIVNRFKLGAEQPLNLAYDEANHRLLAVDQGHPKMRGFQERGIPGYESRHPGHRVVAIDLNTEKMVAEMPASGPVNLKLDPARQRLLVTNRESGEITVFDSNTYRQLHSISTPAHPNTLAIAKKNGDVYATVKNGEDAAKGTFESVARIQF